MEFRPSPTAPSMRATGSITTLMARANFPTQTAMFTKATLMTANQTATELIFIRTSDNTKANGSTTNRKALAKKNGMMALPMRATIRQAKSRITVNNCG